MVEMQDVASMRCALTHAGVFSFIHVILQSFHPCGLRLQYLMVIVFLLCSYRDHTWGYLWQERRKILLSLLMKKRSRCTDVGRGFSLALVRLRMCAAREVRDLFRESAFRPVTGPNCVTVR
ncbi:MAG: hypothetical protein HUU09_10665 [Candidatus Jettenia caeni]|nr:hypothetical protein [Candidatus Jettenia caeni]